MFGYRTLGNLTRMSLKCSTSQYIPKSHHPKIAHQEIQTMFNRISIVPNSIMMMNLRELLLKAKTECTPPLEAIESLINGTTLTDVLGIQHQRGAGHPHFLELLSFSHNLGTKTGVTLSDRPF